MTCQSVSYSRKFGDGLKRWVCPVKGNGMGLIRYGKPYFSSYRYSYEYDQNILSTDGAGASKKNRFRNFMTSRTSSHFQKCPSLLAIFMALFSIPLSATAESSQNISSVENNNVTVSSSCQAFPNEESRYAWWTEKYGVNVMTGSLLLSDSGDDTLRLGRVFLMKRSLQMQNKLDYQKYMVLELETLTLLDKLYGESNELYQILVKSSISEIGSDITDLMKAKICAFECISGSEGAISDDFRECVAQ